MRIIPRLSILLACQLLLPPLFLPGQTGAETTFEELCKKGRAEAWKDIEAGKLVYYDYGIPLPPDSDWYVYLNILWEDYGIETRHAGCIATPDVGCYDEVMRAQIKRKFGEEVFEHAQKKFNELDASGWLRSPALFDGGEDGFFQYIYCNMPDDFFVPANESRPAMTIAVYFDDNGAVSSFEVSEVSDILENKNYTAEMGCLLNNMRNWKPAIRRGKPAPDNQWFSFEFTREIKAKYCNCKTLDRRRIRP